MTFVGPQGWGGHDGRPTLPAQSRLLVTGASKSFGGVRALDGAGLDIPAGSVHAILGENGAGKSTLAKIIAGIVTPDSGELKIDGVAYAAGSVRAAHANGVHCVFQEISLVPQWTVAQNLLLPDRALASRWHGKPMTKTAQALLERYELDVDADALTSHLSLAQRQAVELVRNAISNPKVLILDEATSALTPPEVRWLFGITRRLVAAGTTVLYVSHRMAEVAELADHGTVMRDGKVVGTFTRDSFHADEVLTLMAGRPTAQVYPPLAPHPSESADVLLDVRGLRTERLQALSIQLRRGEVVGLGGLQGQGQADLLRALAVLSTEVGDTGSVSLTW